MNGFLHRYYLNNSNKNLYKWFHYFDIYEKHFARFRGKSPLVLEIGVAEGGSLGMWKEYFGPGCRILGIDNNPECATLGDRDISIRIGEQQDKGFLGRLLGEFGLPDIVIDDGSHIMSHVTETFRALYPAISPNGVYLVEDMHTAYLPDYEGGVGKPGTFIELCKGLIDEMNALYTNGEVPVTTFTTGTDSMTFYDSVVVFEKRPQGKRQTSRTGPMGG
jgi:hypothetical protein